jgi:hypothetical protein
VPDDVKQLLATEAALDKLGARGISTAEAGQTLWNRHVVIKNLRGSPERPQRDARRLLIGRTDAGDAAALQRIAHDQGERPGEVVRSLIREASRRAS